MLCLLAVVIAANTNALACACCVNPGYYEIPTIKPTSVDFALFEEFRFEPPANIYLSEAGFDQVMGLDELRRDAEAQRPIDLEAEQHFQKKGWRLKLRSASGREGSLNLPIPATILKFKVDLHDNAPNTETSLYKELRFQGIAASGTGMFRKDITKGTKFFLVLQGRGNGCDSSSDFSHWRLELNGPKARYAFFGTLAP